MATLIPTVLTFTSTSFSHNDTIPSIYTCDGEDISPALNWTGIPAGTKSLALIVDDPDAPDPAAPKKTWVQWVRYSISPDTIGLAAGISEKNLPPDTLQGINDWKRTGYGGPCPPVGNHRYYHKLYALDTVPPDFQHPAKAAIEQAMQSHIIGHGELIGRYQRHF